MSNIDPLAPTAATPWTHGPLPPGIAKRLGDAPPASPEHPSTILDLSQPPPSEVAELLAAPREDAGEALRQAVEEAIGAISWLLESLGMDPERAREARAALRDSARAEVESRLEAASGAEIEIHHEQRVSLEIREVEITVGGGGSALQARFSSLSLTIETETTIRMRARAAETDESQGRRQVDPLVLDLSGDGIRLTPPEGGEVFDIDGDGTTERTAWVAGDDALLAMDRDGDGAITSGRELFGEANGGRDGFDELRRLDANADGVIDAADPGYASLLLLREGGRLDSLADAGIARIRLDVITPVHLAAGGGTVVAQSLFERSDGSRGTIADALFDVTV
ncbi:MAG: hypothetical protein AB1918_13500 [Pseudomonadota bacterium]